jgi:hypothetical protein
MRAAGAQVRAAGDQVRAASDQVRAAGEQVCIWRLFPLPTFCSVIIF